MSYAILNLTSQHQFQYEWFIKHAPMAMFNHSFKYRELLNQILSDSNSYYLCVFDGDDLLAALPVYVKHGALGAIVNSLPFYGSHGGIVTKEFIGEEVLRLLFDALDDLCYRLQARVCTLIESPLEPNKHMYDYYKADLFDMRIGQMSLLPAKSTLGSIEETLLTGFHQKTRNIVRKSLKGGFDITHDPSDEAISTLHTIHQKNMSEIGGMVKPLSVFQSIRDVFKYDEDYRIYTARKQGKIVSALLLFYFKDTVEYFTPATLEEYRSDQPLSGLIFQAMIDAIIEKGAKRWNWGGTWLNQSGVYHFKSRWGTVDYPYKYHIKIYDDKFNIGGISKDEIISMYPYFYVLPFKN